MSLTVTAEDGETEMFGYHVSDLQTGAAVVDNKITGTLNYIDSGSLADYWGAGYFLALKFTNIDTHATSVKVGLSPSQGSGLVEIINDPDKNGAFKITNKDTQVFKVIQIDGPFKLVQTYDLSELILASQG